MNRPLSCFLHPRPEDEPKSINDECPDCGNPYGFPLTDHPEFIREFKVRRAISRGFYGAVYHVTRGTLNKHYVLKVVPEKVYKSFGKDFNRESEIHNEVAEGCEHLVGIHDNFNVDVDFGDISIPCHVAQLDYIEGPPLDEFLRTEPSPSSLTVAQIVLDLLQLLDELQVKATYHNDLHDSNIIVHRLQPGSRRADALDESIRTIAVDLGSVADRSKSGTTRLSDLQSICSHIAGFASRLTQPPDEASEIDYRLAAKLQEIAQSLASEPPNLRPPQFDVLRREIRQSFDVISAPWRDRPPLSRFSDSYNAHTLHPWFVSKLLEDPDGEWLREISVQGPLVISGMRGCGKTMLLRSLMFHARAAEDQDSISTQPIVDRLAADHFVGLYVSCNQLLDPLGRAGPHHLPEARLFVSFVLEALRAIRHLREIDSSLPSPSAATQVGRVLASCVGEVPTDLPENEWELEQLTLRILASLRRGESRHTLETDPSAAFIALAEAIRTCSTIWAGSSTFFLLDDVSSRHLDAESIQRLVSRLIFSNEMCAFKMTTEQQTLETVLKSPGLIKLADPTRDYRVFDLGASVNERMTMPLREGGRSNFIRAVLERRAEHYQAHPKEVSPADLLGDTKLETIAERIAYSSHAGNERKQLYHGLRALTAVCVGDVGDVIAIYDTMLRKYRQSGQPTVPIPPTIQHDTFREKCNDRLFHVNHRDGRFKDYAVGFAQAARELLMKSASSGRLRQYSKIHVQLPTNDSEEQFKQLCNLVDAGVFVLQGGTSRVRSRDSDPHQQFILKYRKLFGLSNTIGLADRDRFELSGDNLRNWLSEPERCREILMQSVGSREFESLVEDAADAEAPLDDECTHQREEADDDESFQLPLGFFDSQLDDEVTHRPLDGSDFLARRTPVARELTPTELDETDVRSLVLGLGFEKRTLESARRVLDAVNPDHAMLIRYREPGHREEIQELVTSSIQSVEVIDYSELSPNTQPVLPPGPMLVDVTGLAKPVIFQTTRRALMRDGLVIVAHTEAEEHYPLNENIEQILNADEGEDAWAVLQRLEDEVWLGEKGPYKFEPLLFTDADESRRRYLLASASPKHHRLLSLVEERDFDCIDVLSPPEGTSRSEVARLAARIASSVAESSGMIDLGSDDLPSALNAIVSAHHRYYINGNYNFELGLTGSKLHAVAFAAASASMQMSQAWYVKPAEFDPTRFSIGFGDTRFLEITMPAST